MSAFEDAEVLESEVPTEGHIPAPASHAPRLACAPQGDAWTFYELGNASECWITSDRIVDLEQHNEVTDHD